MRPPLACIIPARGGSKRLPHKNITPFFGHPLLAYTIAAARASGLFGRIIVSTDDADIGRIATHYGAEYLERPQKLATDSAGLVEVAQHFLDFIEQGGGQAEAFCQLMPNCPLRRAEDILAHYHLFEARRDAFQISVVPYRGVYPHWATIGDGDGKGSWFFGEHYLVQSQDLEKVYCPTGAIWWARVREFRAQRKFYGTSYGIAPMDPDRGLDIDTKEELDLADVIVRGLRDRDGVSPLQPVSEPQYARSVGDQPPIA